MKAAKRAYREAKRALETLEHDKNRSAEITAAKETFKKLKAAYKALKRGDEHGTKRKQENTSRQGGDGAPIHLPLYILCACFQCRVGPVVCHLTRT